MVSLFPAVIHYDQDFIPNDMKQAYLERTVDGRKQKRKIQPYIHWG